MLFLLLLLSSLSVAVGRHSIGEWKKIDLIEAGEVIDVNARAKLIPIHSICNRVDTGQ